MLDLMECFKSVLVDNFFESLLFFFIKKKPRPKPSGVLVDMMSVRKQKKIISYIFYSGLIFSAIALSEECQDTAKNAY